jgi:dienelactone hydrolase
MENSKKHLSLAGENGRVMMADLHLPKDAEVSSLVIYAHGINGFKDWGGMDLIARHFADHGHAFLKFNYSHNGTTPESPEAFADTEAYGNDNYGIRQRDLKSILDFTRTQDELSHVDNITLIGHSRGGTDVILYATGDERISRIITWAASAEAKTPWRKWDQF